MRQLRFVTPTEDGNQLLVETTDDGEQFALTVDEALRAATRQPKIAAAGQASPAAPAPAAEAPIRPREIQVRVRAGESPQQIADEFGMDISRVMRFAAAVVDERTRIAAEARRARARRTGTDGAEHQVVVFGEAVDARFQAHGIDAESVTWDSRRREDGEWLVAAQWLGGDATHTAEWLFHRGTRSVTPIDDAAADLLSDRPIRPIAPPAPEPARPSLSAAPPLARGIVAFPPMPDAHTAPVPVIEEVFDQEAPPEGPRDIPPLVPAAAAMDFDEPPLPLGITDPETRPAAAGRGAGALRNLGVSRREESEEERAARARVPSWDDILLGIKRKE